MICLRRIAVAFATILSSAAGAAPSWSVEAGVIGGDGARGLFRAPEDYSGLKLDARLLYPFQSGSFALRGFADHELGEGSSRREAEVQEVLYTWRGDRWEAALGRQRLQWGRADGINPTDVWTPRAFDRATLYDVEQYRGADTVRVSYLPDEATHLSLLLLPRFRPSRYGPGLFAELPSPPTASNAIDDGRPGWAVRYETTGTALDFALTAADTAELTPYFRPATGAAFEARYGRLTMLGADAAYAVDRWVYRAETAWRRREDDASGLAPADSVDVIVGVEREIAEGWLGNVQFIDTRNRGGSDTGGALASISSLNRTLFHQQRDHYSAFSLGLNWRPADQRGEVSVLHARYSGGESYSRLRAEYPVYDRFKLGALYERFAGPNGSTFDFLSRNNVAWLSLSVAFGNL